MPIDKIIKKNHYDKSNKCRYDIVEYLCDNCNKRLFYTITPITAKYCVKCSQSLQPELFR